MMNDIGVSSHFVVETKLIRYVLSKLRVAWLNAYYSQGPREARMEIEL